MVPRLLGEPTARRVLGIADDKPIVAMRAVDLHNQWKGGRLFHGLHKALLKRSEVALFLFGRSSETLDCAKSLIGDGRSHDAADSWRTYSSARQRRLKRLSAGLPIDHSQRSVCTVALAPSEKSFT
jgi:hypothetical protein